MKPTIEQVREALNEVGPGMDVERFRALAASLDGMVLVPREPTKTMVTRLTNALAWRFKGVMFEDEKVRAAMLAAQEDRMTSIFDPDFDAELSPDDPDLGLLIAGALLAVWLLDDPDNADNCAAGMAIANAQEAGDPDAFLAAVKRGRDLLAAWCENDERTREADMGPAEEAETLAEVDAAIAAHEAGV